MQHGVTFASCTSTSATYLNISRPARSSSIAVPASRVHGLGALLELDADALAVDGGFVAVPAKPSTPT